MSALLRGLCRSLERRLKQGVPLESLLQAYPKLTEREREEVREYFET